MFSVVTAHAVTRPSSPATVVNDIESVASEMFNKNVMAAETLFASSHMPYMGIAVPVCMRGNSNTIARSP